ncbi:MAG: hypothetical protein WBM40_17900 [Thiohalocapsa sp.]
MQIAPTTIAGLGSFAAKHSPFDVLPATAGLTELKLRTPGIRLAAFELAGPLGGQIKRLLEK